MWTCQATSMETSSLPRSVGCDVSCTRPVAKSALIYLSQPFGEHPRWCTARPYKAIWQVLIATIQLCPAFFSFFHCVVNHAALSPLTPFVRLLLHTSVFVNCSVLLYTADVKIVVPRASQQSWQLRSWKASFPLFRRGSLLPTVCFPDSMLSCYYCSPLFPT